MAKRRVSEDGIVEDSQNASSEAIASEVVSSGDAAEHLPEEVETPRTIPSDELLAPSDSQAELPTLIDETDHHELVAYAVPNKQPMWRKLAIFTVVCLVFFGAAFALYRLLLRQGSFGQVKIAGVKIERGADRNKLISEINDKYNEVTYTIDDGSGELARFTPADAGIDMLAAASLDKALQVKEQGSIWQRLQWWRTSNLDVVLSVDYDKLAQFVDEKMTKVTAASTNATLVVENGEVKISPSSSGKGLSIQNASTLLTAAASKLLPQTFKLKETTLEPHVSYDDVQAIKLKIEKTLEQPVSFTVANKTFSATRSDIGSWVSPISLEDKKPVLEFNSGEIEAFIDKIAANYVNPARSEIIMHKSDGTEQLLVAGKNGTDVINKDAVAAEVSQNLLAGKAVDIKLSVGEQAYSKISAEDYDKWVVVDLTNKYMEIYEKSKLVNTFKVSAGAPATPTVLGQFKILHKLTTQDMRGLNADGTSYFQPRVEYVNYFFSGYAVHGVYWRPDWWFGQVNSSHGCIGLRTSEAKWFFEWAPVGTVIITHQ